MFSKKIKNFVQWFRIENGTPEFIKRRRIGLNPKTINFDKKTEHPIVMRTPTFRKKNKRVFCFDIDKYTIEKVKEKDNKTGKVKEIEKVISGGQMGFEGSNLDYDPEELAFVRTGIVKDLTATLHAKLLDTNSIILMIISALAGVFAGIFIAGFF